MFSKEYFQSLESSWDRLKTCEKPIFIYGMGDGAEKLLDEFDRLGIKCTGVFATILPYILPRNKAFVKKLSFVKAM